MQTYVSFPHYLFRDNKKLGYNRGFDTLAKARKYVNNLRSKAPYVRPLTQIRKIKQPGTRKAVYAVYSTWY